MKTWKSEPWLQGIWLVLLLGLLLGAGRACRTKTDCECSGQSNCGECIGYREIIGLQEEARTNLNAIYVAQLSYFSNGNTYANEYVDYQGNTLNAFQIINWCPLADHRYAYFLPGAEIQPDITEPYSLPAGLAPAVSGLGFTAVAVGNVDCDTVLDVWTINDAKNLQNLVNDVVE